MNAYQLMSESPWLTFFLLCLALNVVPAIFTRFYRMIMVSVRGWPPAHLDADGDWKPEPKVAETTKKVEDTKPCSGPRSQVDGRGFNPSPTTRHPRPGDPEYIASIDS